MSQFTNSGPRDAAPVIVGQAPSLTAALERARRAAVSNLPILIGGESGTGKELLARYVHDQSARAKGPYVVVNCAAFPPELIDSELFGYERGAFTGAHASHMGWFHAAHNGTLVLDEIGEMPLVLQPKLLRVLEDGIVTRVGSRQGTRLDVRVVAVTNRNLPHQCATNSFRLDLFHRLSGVALSLPPLRERTGDLRALVNHFAEQAARSQGFLANNERLLALSLSPAGQRKLEQHPWPGNLRELRYMVARTVALHGYPFHEADLLAEMSAPAYQETSAAGLGSCQTSWLSPDQSDAPAPTRVPAGWVNLNGKTWSQLETELIQYQLAQARGNRRQAARALGISRTTLYERLRQISSEDGFYAVPCLGSPAAAALGFGVPR